MMSQKLRILLLTAAGATSGLAVGASPPSTSAYFTDTQNSYVQDATSESIGQVNMIACIMSSMRPDALVNQGPYIALVDQNKCDASKRSSTSSSGSDGASQASNFMTVTVNSTRASNSDPMIVKAWVNDEQNGQPETVFVHISATEAPSTANPYGAFRIDFCGKATGGGACMMNGFMQGGAGALSYYQNESGGGGGGGSRTTALKLSSVGTSTGSGALHVVQGDGNGGSQTSAFAFAYDQSYFLRDDGTSNGAQCFARDATDPATGLSVWSYGLYDSTTGARVDLNSGFPIEYTPTSGGTTYQGYLGYWGLSLPSAATATLVTGSTVQKVDYSSSGGAPTRTSYTILQNGGKLTRYTKKTRTLHDLDQIHFDAGVGDVGNSGLPTPNTQYEMYWDDASSKFVATAVMQCSQNGCQTSNLPNNTNISVDPSFWLNSGGIQGWSQSLGGDLFIDLHGLSGPIVSTAITVAYRVQDLVYPGDATVPSTLYCLNNCPTVASLSNYFTQGGTPVESPYAAGTYNNFSPVPAGGVASYTVDANATLNDSSTAAVTYTNAIAYQQYPQYQNGVQSGRLFGSLNVADCTMAGGNPQYCDYLVNSADVYYVWETGPNSWNQFTAVKDGSNNFVHFDTPLQVNYSVPNDPIAYGAYANTALVLQYGGFGNLWGIPGSCVSQLTNATEDCSIQGARYVPQFAIPYDPTATPQQGIVTTTTSGTTTTYLVKWLEREIRFATKATSVCTADQLAAPTNVILPTVSDLKDPSDSSSDVYLGTEPAVTSAPRVIQGEVKY